MKVPFGIGKVKLLRRGRRRANENDDGDMGACGSKQQPAVTAANKISQASAPGVVARNKEEEEEEGYGGETWAKTGPSTPQTQASTATTAHDGTSPPPPPKEPHNSTTAIADNNAKHATSTSPPDDAMLCAPPPKNDNHHHPKLLGQQDGPSSSSDGYFSTDSNSSHSSSGNNNNDNSNDGNHIKPKEKSNKQKRRYFHHSSSTNHNKDNNNNNCEDLSASHRRRKSDRLNNLNHSDSKLGLAEIICGDLPNPNLVRIEVPLGKPIEEVYEGVHDGPVLGSGVSGIVRLVRHRATQVTYAVKCLDLALIDSEEGLKQLKEEIYIMCQLDHPNIVRLEEVYESHSEIYLVQEVCKGGELFDRLDEQPDYHYTEAQCARLVKQMLSSVRYIHNKGIIHRDLKLENFLFSDAESGSELKMIDFGLSKHFTFGEVHHEAVGTPYTVAPEVVRGSYDERCDVWAIGVITYLLLSGEPPFGGCGGPETLLQVRDNILRGAFEFEPAEVWQTVSQEAKDFILSLLVVDPVDRPTARQAKDSRWLKMWSNRENNGKNEADSMINPNVVKALVGFKEYSDMRKLLCEVLSFTLLPEQIQGLRKEFEKYDREGTGEITLSTLKKVLIGNASTGSLGGLTEEEVVDIFNAMRVRKGETSIHWHDFIAAGLSQCQVDDRNLRLAFERLDQDHKGYITFENVMDLMGDDAFETEDQMLKMWGESMKDVNLRFISYDDFVLLMKGQKRDIESRIRRASVEGLAAVPEINTSDEESRSRRSSLEGLAAVLENTSEEEEEDHLPAAAAPALLDSFQQPSFPSLPLDAAAEETTAEVSKPKLSPKKAASPEFVPATASPRAKTFVRMGSNSAPATPIHFGKRFDEAEQEDSPLSMDDGIGDSGRSQRSGSVSFNEHVAFQMPELGNFTPPQTPVRGPADYVTPTTVARITAKMDPQLMSRLSPPDLSLPPSITALEASTTRGRSVSLDEKETLATEFEKRRSSMFKRDSRRALAIPEHTHNVSGIDRVIEDKTKTPLVVNRALYRAHREFRHAVTEACKRFEDEQMRRAKETLQARESAVAKCSAGLVMRHGQALSEQSIKNFLKKTLEEQQRQVDQANRRGGRGRRSRKKTISDMSGMMASPGAMPETTSAVTVRQAVGNRASVPNKDALAPVSENENLLRNPTKPGEFRKTNYDPFQRKFIFEKKGSHKSPSTPPSVL